MNAYFFIVPEFVNKKKLYVLGHDFRDDNAGMVIGSHSMSHTDLTSLIKRLISRTCKIKNMTKKQLITK